MMRFLFPRLTPREKRGRLMFEALVGEARQEHWFVEGGIADTLDGRFALLATIVALATVRLERGGASAHAQAVALAERFVEAMDAEHREIGIGEPGLGKKVRRLVGALARRVELWRNAVDGDDWDEAVSASLFSAGTPEPAGPEGRAHCSVRLREYWMRIERMPDSDLAEGSMR